MLNPTPPNQRIPWENLASLTNQERRVFNLILQQDATCKEIASQLCIEVDTVEKHRKNIVKKLGLNGKIAFRRFIRQLQILAANGEYSQDSR